MLKNMKEIVFIFQLTQFSVSYTSIMFLKSVQSSTIRLHKQQLTFKAAKALSLPKDITLENFHVYFIDKSLLNILYRQIFLHITDEWIYQPTSESVLEDAGPFEIEFYIQRRRGTVSNFVKNRECYEIEIYMDDSGHAY